MCASAVLPFIPRRAIWIAQSRAPWRLGRPSSNRGPLGADFALDCGVREVRTRVESHRQHAVSKPLAAHTDHGRCCCTAH